MPFASERMFSRRVIGSSAIETRAPATVDWNGYGDRRALREIETEVKHRAADGDHLQPAAAAGLRLRDRQLALVDLLDRLVGGIAGGLRFAAAGVEERDGGDREHE